MSEMQNVPDTPGATEKTPRKAAVPFRERVACSIDEACAAGGFGRTTAYGLIGSGRLKTTKLGKRTLVLIDSLIKLIDPERVETSALPHRRGGPRKRSEAERAAP